MISFIFFVFPYYQQIQWTIHVSMIQHEARIQPRWIVHKFSSQTLFFSPTDIEFHHSYLQRLIQDTRPLYMIAAREQIISFTKQVIGWHLKAWNSDACLKNALSCEPSGMYCWCALFPQISFHPRLPISPSAGNPVSSDFLLLTDLRNEDGDPNVPLRHILINLD